MSGGARGIIIMMMMMTTPKANNDTELDLSNTCISFLHLDLGIGGAEQLVLQLAHASVALMEEKGNNDDDDDDDNDDNDKKNRHNNKNNNRSIELWTTRCDPDHCFAAVRPGTGVLHHALRVRGRWIPAEVWGGRLRALCSSLRLWYLTACWIWEKQRETKVSNNNGPPPTATTTHIVVVDVLPTPLPVLRWCTTASLLFYCHFPDQLLVRGNNDASATRSIYRRVLNALENATMPAADTIVVNSQFTRQVVQDTFPALRHSPHSTSDQTTLLPVLYPALDTTSLDADNNNNNKKTKLSPIVSLNRYERKKNLQLLLQAVAWIRQHHPDAKLPPIIIAGGYDTSNVENVEYRAELAQWVRDLHLDDDDGVQVEFQLSISDAARRKLLRTALCVCYTPSHEHFGIVPLEAMYCQTPVLAVNNGGPVESVVDGVTGYLREPTAAAFGAALWTWIRDPDLAQRMGEAGRSHVQAKFGMDPRLVQEWKALLATTVQRGRQRQQSTGYRVTTALMVYGGEALLVIIVYGVLLSMLRRLQLVEEDESLLSGIRRNFQREEL